MKKRTQVFLYGIVFIILAIIDAIMLFMDFNEGFFDEIAHPDPTVESVTNIVLYVLLAWATLSILIEFYLGIKGLADSRGPAGSRLHIFIARVIGIINVILLLILGLSLLDSTDLLHDLETVGLCLVDIILMFSYANAAKAVHNFEP